MKIATVVGARPQFIKAALVSHELRKQNTEILIHTGQHFDDNMSGRFFRELNIPEPDYNLGISGGTHGQMTGRMLIAIEEILQKEMPDRLLVYGDTNSTLAAALAAAKLHIPVCHVEAGVRTHSATNPEEINRICTDHLSSLLFASTTDSMEELKREGLSEKSFLSGDLMYDAYLTYSGKLQAPDILLKTLTGNRTALKGDFYYLTCHREENTKNDENLLGILSAMDELDAITVYPVHPRNIERAERLKEEYGLHNILMVEPVGYLESLALLKGAKKVVTDSGGLQREAFFAGKKCVTILDFVVWQETMVDGRNTLSSPSKEEILCKLEIPQRVDPDYKPFGDGHAARRIVDEIGKHFED